MIEKKKLNLHNELAVPSNSVSVKGRGGVEPQINPLLSVAFSVSVNISLHRYRLPTPIPQELEIELVANRIRVRIHLLINTYTISFVN